MATSTRSRYCRLLFAVALIFALMTPLAAAAQDSPDWSFRTETPHDIWSEGGSWAVGTEILVTVNDDISGPEFATTVQVEQWGSNPGDVGWYVNTSGFAIETGDEITVDDGTYVKYLDVSLLTIDAIDASADTITGTAPPGLLFPVHATDGATDANVDVTSDVGGAWTADFSGIFDIGPGTWGSAAIFDDEGDATQRSWNIPVPTIEAQPQNDIVQGQQLEIGVAVSVEIDDPANGGGVDWSDSGIAVPTPWDPSSGYIEFDPGSTGFDVGAGQEITLSDGVSTKVMTVAPLEVTDIDPVADLVHGTASSGAELNVWADTDGSNSNRVVTAASDGSWTADFSIAWEGWDPLDLRGGSHVDVWEGDADGDTTRAWRYEPNPQFSVETPNQVWSQGDGWVAGRTVTIAVNDGATDVYSTTAEVEAWGPNPWEVGWSADTGSFEIQPGHLVTVDDGGGIVRTLAVVGLEVINVDEGGDTISGIAPANAWIDAHANDGVTDVNRRVQASGAGIFTVDFGTPGAEDWEQDTLDVRPGVGGAVQVFEEDGDSTHRGWRVVSPYFGVDVVHEEMWAFDWPIGATLDFDVFEPPDLVNPVWSDSMTVVDTTWGQSEAGYRFWGDFDVTGGQYITITDGTTTKELTVSTLEVTNVDADTDTYTGTVVGVDDRAYDVCAWARDLNDPQQGIELCALPDPGDGSWTIDFTGVGDIVPGDHTGAYQNDADGDQTSYAWFVPPWIYVELGDDTNPDFPDRIQLDQWDFPVQVTNGIDTVTVADADGDGWEMIEFDVSPGQTITATGNDGRTKSLYLEELSVDTVTLWNEDPPSTVYGSTTATYGGNVQVTASAGYGWWTERWVEAGGGSYAADFANPGNGWREQELGYFGQGGSDDVIETGGEIRAHIWDGDNDQVQSIWHSTNPRIIIVRGNDRIEAIDFPKGEPLTIELDDPAFDGIEFSETGIPAANPDKPWETLLIFELGDYTVPDAATVTAYDEGGTPLVATEVIPFTIDAVDQDADTITGTAPEGSEVLVEADGNWRYPIADETNTWIADFSQPGDQPGEENPVDIGPGSSGGATLLADGGSATTVLWSISSARFWVDPDGEHVWGNEFAADTSVTIAIDGTDHGPFGTDGGGNFDVWFDAATVDIVAGSAIVVSDGDASKAHEVTALGVTGADESLDQVTGVAEIGSSVNVWENDTGAWRDVVASDGTWVADFAGEADLVAGSNGGAEQCDDDYDCTHLPWNVANPNVQVDPRNDGVWGDQWAPEGEVTIFINDAEHSTLTTDEWGNFGEGWDPQGLDIVAGDKVEAKQGDVTKTHVVTSLAVTDIDVDNDIMNGTADGPFDIWVHDTDAWRHLEHQGGTWSIDWSVPAYDEHGNGTADLEPGSNGNSNECDDDGDCTWADWNVARPIFRVDPVNGGIWGHEWYEVGWVTITVDGVPLESVEVNEDGDWWSGTDPEDLAPGIVVEVSGDGVTKTLVVTELAVTLVDAAEDAVLGAAAPTTSVMVEVHDVPEGIWRAVVADAATGEWSADFTDPISTEHGEGSISFEPGVHGSAYQQDDDGDTVWIDWSVRFARIGVEPRSDSLWGNEFEPNTTVSITINGDDYGSLPTNEWGDWGEGWDPMGLDITAGMEIVVSDGITTKTHEVTPLAVTSIDVDTNIMAGTALPEHGFSIWVHDSDAYEWVVADAFGDWTVDWSPQVDLERGSNGNSQECDDDGDCTWAGWGVANPTFSVERPFALWSTGEGWVEGRTVTFVIDDDENPGNGVLYTGDVPVERWGPEPWEVGWSFDEDPELFQIMPGNYVSVDDGVDITKSLWVDPLEITDIDEASDTITGVASEFAVVEIHAGYPDEEPAAWRTVEADADGLWVASFGVPGDEEHEQDAFDIDIDTGGAAQVFDEDGDSTHMGWYLEEPALPSFFVRPDGDELWGHEWFGSDDVTVAFYDGDPGALLFETVVGLEDGYFEAYVGDDFDILPGHYVVVTDGESTKTHFVTALMVTSVDVDADMVHGTAEPGTEVFVGSSMEGLAFEQLNFVFGPDNRNPDSLNEYLEFRQAVAHAIDRDRLVTELAKAAYGIDSYVEAFLPALSGDAWAAYPYDPAVAEVLISGLCTDLGRDCVANPPVAVLTTSGDNDTRAALADLLVPMFDAAGIELQLDLEDGGSFGETIFGATGDIASWAWVGSPQLSSLVGFHWVFDPEERFDLNFQRWGTPDSSQDNAATQRMGELIGLMEAAHDPGELEAHIVEAEQILADQVVFVPLFAWDGGVWSEEPIEVEGPYRVVVADPDGNWTADFSQPWEDQGTLDIGPGIGGFAEQSDEDGDATHAGWYVEDGENHPPEILEFTGPEVPMSYKLEVFSEASFVDPDGDEELTVIIDWGDGTSSQPEPVFSDGIGEIADSHFYMEPGIYTLTLTVTDSAGASTTATYEYAVMYDPAGKRITAAVQVVDETTTMHLGLNVWPDKRSGMPRGHVRFNAGGTGFAQGFDATEIGYLLIFGDWGIVTGTGTIDGQGEYQFLVSVLDQSTSGGIDAFRVILWDDDGVVFDTQPGDDATAMPTTQPTNGDIKVR